MEELVVHIHLMFYVPQGELQRWLLRAHTTNTIYFRARRDLFGSLCDIVSTEPPGGAYVTLPVELWVTIKLFLTSRNDQLTNDSRLAFERALSELDAIHVVQPRGVIANVMAALPGLPGAT